MKWRPKLRTVLIAVNIVVLAMPLAALGLFRIYDTELIRRTEAELIAQIAFADSLYRHHLKRHLADESLDLGTIGRAGDVRWPVDAESGLRPIPNELKLSLDEIRPRAEDAQPTGEQALPAESAAGAAVSSTLRDTQRVTLAGIRIVNPDGVVVGSTRGEIGMSLAHREEVRRALNGEFVSFARERLSDSPVPGLDSISRRSKIRVFVAMPIVLETRRGGTDQIVGAVVASRTPIGLQKAVYDNRGIFGFIFIGLVMVVLVISLLTSFTIARPIRALRDKAQALADPSEPLESTAEPGTEEVEELTRTILATARSLREREQYLQTFARDVRHEFKAPLSSLRGAVELLQEHVDTMETDRRDRFLSNLLQDVDRLEALTQDLLELARADVAKATDETSRVAEVLERVTREDVELETDIDEGLAVRVPADDLEAMLRNLLGNVALHGGGEAALIGRREDDRVVLRVSDSGPGFDAEMLERATEAFTTTARGRGGTGLGLSIIRGYVDAHGGEVELANRDGAVVTIWLPAAG